MDAHATGDPVGGQPFGPHNTVTVVDPSPVNWLSITWNTMEEANRVDHDGIGQPSLAESWRWLDSETLELTMRQAVYQDGEPFNAGMFKLGFDKVQE
ncbi:ABC transporter substrate-binding protein, partial [Lactobacillus crispatus]